MLLRLRRRRRLKPLQPLKRAEAVEAVGAIAHSKVAAPSGPPGPWGPPGLGALRPLDFFLCALQALNTQTIVAVTTEIKMVRGVCFLQSYLIITVTGLTDTENLNVHHLHNHQSTITPTRSGLLSTSSAISFIKLLQSNFDLCTFACLIFAMPHKKRK